jgi:hypothetical protein
MYKANFKESSGMNGDFTTGFQKKERRYSIERRWSEFNG